MKPLLTIIVPFLNEQESIPLLVTSLSSFLGEKHTFQAEVIFVNDGSTDGSLNLLKAQNHLNYSCKIISFSKNFGSHAALRAGIQHSKGQSITFMYADLQDPLELIDRLYTEIEKGVEIAWAYRNSTENGILERTFSKAYSLLMKKYAVPAYPDKGFDIVMFTQKTRNLLNQNIEANSSVFLQILTLGFQQTIIGYDKQVRRTGESKWTIGKKMKLLIDSFVAFSYAPIRFVTIMGFFLLAGGLLWSCYLVVRQLMFNNLNPGWPAMMSLLLIGFGVTNISLGIIAEYLWRTLDASRKRPVFIVDEIIDLN
jgi:glycosyltransferase involved in cell wall biosynthesis